MLFGHMDPWGKITGGMTGSMTVTGSALMVDDAISSLGCHLKPNCKKSPFSVEGATETFARIRTSNLLTFSAKWTDDGTRPQSCCGYAAKDAFPRKPDKTQTKAAKQHKHRIRLALNLLP